jgi:hypothetical protein
MTLSTNKLAREINRLHRSMIEAAVKTLDEAIRAGELLKQAKEKVGHGDWELWMESNLQFSKQTARRYMCCFDNRDRLKTLTVSDLGAVYQLLTNKKTNAMIDHFTGDQESYTPSNYIESVRRCSAGSTWTQHPTLRLK